MYTEYDSARRELYTEWTRSWKRTGQEKRSSFTSGACKYPMSAMWASRAPDQWS